MKDAEIITATFSIGMPDSYNCNLQFLNGQNKVVLEKNIEITRENSQGKYTVAGFLMNSSEKESFSSAKKAKVTVKKKP